MIDLKDIDHIYLYPGLTDMRLGITGIRKLILETGTLEIRSLYLFCGKTRNQIKVLEVEENSIWLYQNKMKVGKFIWPEKGHTTELSKDQLAVIVKGLSLVAAIESGNNQKQFF